MNIKRRSFLQTAGTLPMLPMLASGLGISFRDAGASTPGDILLCIFQRGGVDGLNMIVPYGDDDYYQWRPQLAIPRPGEANGALDLDGFFAMHPGMAALKTVYDAGDLAVVHATGSPHETHSHFDAMDFMERAYLEKGGVFSGWIGRHLESAGINGISSRRNTEIASPFRAVAIGNATPRSLNGDGVVVPVALSDIASFGVRTADALIEETLEFLYDGGSFLDGQAQQTFAAAELLASEDPTQYQPENGALYPGSEFGQALLQAAQLIKTETLAVETICIDIGGWDHHNQEMLVLPGLLADFSDSLAAFYTDMGTRMASITVLTESEFGRRAYENASQGTDHGHGNCMLAIGGGVNGGVVYADWPGLAQNQLYGNGDLEVTTDWRSVLGELLSKRLLNDNMETLFPGYTMPGFADIFQAL